MNKAKCEHPEHFPPGSVLLWGGKHVCPNCGFSTLVHTTGVAALSAALDGPPAPALSASELLQRARTGDAKAATVLRTYIQVLSTMCDVPLLCALVELAEYKKAARKRSSPSSN